QVLASLVVALADRLRHLVGLAETHADVPALVAHDDQRREAEAAAALDDLGHAVDVDDALLELFLVHLIERHRTLTFFSLVPFPRGPGADQNSRPASRAACARALTRPW